MGLADFRPTLDPARAPTTAAERLQSLPSPATATRLGHRRSHAGAPRRPIGPAHFARLGGTHALKLGFDFETTSTPTSACTPGRIHPDRPGERISLTRYSSPVSRAPIHRRCRPAQRRPDLDTHSHFGRYRAATRTTSASFPAHAQRRRALGGAEDHRPHGAVKIGIYDNWARASARSGLHSARGRQLYASNGWFLRVDSHRHRRPSFSRKGSRSRRWVAAAAGRPVDAIGRIIDIHQCDFGTIQNQKILAACSRGGGRRSRGVFGGGGGGIQLKTSASTSCSAPATSPPRA